MILTTIKNHKKSREEARQIYWKTLFNSQEVWIGQYKRAVARVMAEQEREIISRHEKVFEEWLFGEYTARYLAVLLPLAYALSEDSSRIALDAVGDSETEFTITPSVQRKITNRIQHFAQETDKETRRLLRETLGEGIQNNESRADLVLRVEGVFRDAKGWRAERIANTEVSYLSNEAALESYKQSSVVTGKEWVTEPGCCQYCSAMEGRVVELDTPFASFGESVGGTRGGFLPINYETIQHPPLHPNCRCDIIGFTGDVREAMADREILGFQINDDDATFLDEAGVSFEKGGTPPEPTLVAEYDPKTNQITMYRPDARNARISFMHEIGHAVDQRSDIEGGPLSDGNALAAVDKDREAVIFNRLKMRNGWTDAQTKDGIAKLKPFYEQQFDYYGKPREVFADGYAQYRSDPAAFKEYAPNLYQIYRRLF